MSLILFICTAYCIGSIPFGYLIAQRKHINIQKIGSGNIGATNIGRALGAKYALLVGLLDFLKGVVPLYLCSFFSIPEILILLFAFLLIAGHIFSLFLRFKGGKGVATYAGTLAFLLGLKLFLLIIVVWILCLYITKIMSFTNLIFAAGLPLFVWFTTNNLDLTIYTLLAGILIWWSHRQNIQRLYQGKENKLHLPLVK